MADSFLVLAHQGGWDEVLLVAGPILVFVLLLRTANKRAEEKAHQHESAAADPDSDTAP